MTNEEKIEEFKKLNDEEKVLAYTLTVNCCSMHERIEEQYRIMIERYEKAQEVYRKLIRKYHPNIEI